MVLSKNRHLHRLLSWAGVALVDLVETDQSVRKTLSSRLFESLCARKDKQVVVASSNNLMKR